MDDMNKRGRYHVTVTVYHVENVESIKTAFETMIKFCMKIVYDFYYTTTTLLVQIPKCSQELTD